MKRPAFQFYTGDWQKNAKLRRCSHGARGAWIDVLCLMHDSEEYGVLRWPLKDIAQAAGAPISLLRELVAKDVLKGSDARTEAYVYRPRHAGSVGDPVTLVAACEGPCWYSSRFVRDEWVRMRRGSATRIEDGGAPPPKEEPKTPPKKSPKGGNGDASGDGPSSSSSTTPTPPIPPSRGAAVGLKAWMEAVKAKGELPIPEGDPVFAYADDVGIPPEFLALAWREFRHRYTQPDAKRYRDWRSVFRKAVRGNWLKLWWLDGQHYALTTTGVQAQRAHAKEAA